MLIYKNKDFVDSREIFNQGDQMKKESAYSIEHHESGRYIAWRLNGKRKLRLGSFETYKLADLRIEQAIEVLER